MQNKKLYKSYWILAILCFVFTQSFTQGESNIWTFGHHNGLNFNVNPPVLFSDSLVAIEGSASVCDPNGSLLFYSNGNTVWTANHTIMPNGSGILGNGGAGVPGWLGSCAQGVAIVPVVNNANQYYLFVLNSAEDFNNIYANGKLRYSIVDMSLNGGLGDVIPTQKNIILDSFMSEKMTLTQGNGCYYWLVVKTNNNSNYKSYKIDGTGIAAPVISTGLWLLGDIGGGQMKISPDKTKIAIGSTMYNSIEIANFNSSTGIISNPININLENFGISTGLCFSPNSQKLYISSVDIIQYDLSNFPNANAIANSKVDIPSVAPPSHLRNAPNGKIYMSFFSSHPYLGVIHNPNNTGASVNLDDQAIPLPPSAIFQPITVGNIYGHGLGNDVAPQLSSVLSTHTVDTHICNGNAILYGTGGYDNYLWNTGDTGLSLQINQPGTYWVYSTGNCATHIDTFHVSYSSLYVDLGRDTTICEVSTLTLRATQNSASAQYEWQNNSTDSVLTAIEEGLYHVTVTDSGCTASDSIYITKFNPQLEIVEDDTTICLGATLTLHAYANTPTQFLWSNQSTNNTIEVSQEGLYILRGRTVCGDLEDSVKVHFLDCKCNVYIPSAFSPNNDNKNDYFLPKIFCESANIVNFNIFNRYGTLVYSFFGSYDQLSGWDGMYKNELCPVGVYYYHLELFNGQSIKKVAKGDITLLR